MTKKSVSIILVCALVAIMLLGLVACNNDDSKYTIVYVGDSIAEALIGPSPLSERDNYGYYALVGKTNGFRYYNHSVSGHKTSTGIVSNEGLKEVLNRDDESASLMKTHLKQADMIHISVLGNNMLQYNLGLMMLEVADPQFESKYEAAKNGGPKTLINALEEGSLDEPLKRNSVEKFNPDGTPEVVEFAFPPTYQDISDIVDRLKELNPKATIVFQKVYNPFFEGSKHLSSEVLNKLSEIKDEQGRFGQAGAYITTIEQVRKLADYLLDRLNGILDMYLKEHKGAFITLDAKQAFQNVVNLLDTNEDGSVNISGNSFGRKLIYQDWTHPSNFGHAVIAGMTQDLLDELKVSSPNAVANYKAIRVDQINRLFKNVSGFNADAAIEAINAAETYFDVTMAYFNAIDGVTPIIENDGFKTGNQKTSFDKDMRFDLDVSKLGLMDIDLINPATLTMLGNLMIDKENTYAEFTNDGQMHFQIRTKAGVFGELLNNIFAALRQLKIDIDKETVNEMLSSFEIEGMIDSMVEPMFPGFKAELMQGDLDGALKIIQNSLGFYIEGFDYSDDNIKAILNQVAHDMTLPGNLLDLIPADTVLTLSFDSKYYVKDVKGSDGNNYKGIYVSEIGANSDTQPFCIFDVTNDSKNGKTKLFFRVQFMNLSIGFVEC